MPLRCVAAVTAVLASCTSEGPRPTSEVAPPGGSLPAPSPAPMVETAVVSRADRVAVPVPAPSDSTPAPVTPVWNVSEVAAHGLLEEMRAVQDEAGPPYRTLAQVAESVRLPAVGGALGQGGNGSFDGYCYRCVLSGRDGQPYGDTTEGLVKDAYAIYAWPTEGVGRVMCAFPGGTLVADRVGVYSGMARGPAPDAAFSMAAAATFGAGLLGPTQGRDGGRWGWVAVGERTRETHLQVVDQNGQPVAGFPIFVGQRSLLEGAGSMAALILDLGDRALPLGRIETGENGRAALRGLHAQGMAMVTSHQASNIRVGEANGGLLLTVMAEDDALGQARLNANESAAIATLRNIASAQAQCQASGAQDANANAVGEFGFFGELSGATGVRSDAEGALAEERIVPPMLSGAFGNVEAHAATRSGYLFQIYLPGANGSPMAENAEGGSRGVAVDPAAAESGWFAYAWPSKAGMSGRRAFFVSQEGRVWSTDAKALSYSGAGRRPDARAFFSGARGDEPFSGDHGEKPRMGSDGNAWGIVN